MKVKYILPILLFFAAVSAGAQTLKGTVTETGSNDKMTNVFIRDINSKTISLTDKKGVFYIQTQTGHTLIVSSPGYISDTLYVIDMAPKYIKMVLQGFALREVAVTGTRSAFNPEVEYADVYRKSKVYPLSPSSWLSKEGKDARRLKKYFAIEGEQRHIDAVYTRAYVSSLVPLKGRELENFMFLYRPSYEFITNNNGGSLAAYVSDSYRKYKALPPEKRVVPALGEVR